MSARFEYVNGLLRPGDCSVTRSVIVFLCCSGSPGLLAATVLDRQDESLMRRMLRRGGGLYPGFQTQKIR